MKQSANLDRWFIFMRAYIGLVVGGLPISIGIVWYGKEQSNDILALSGCGLAILICIAIVIISTRLAKDSKC